MKFKIYLLLISFIGIVSCDKIDELTKFDIDYKQSITIPSSTVFTAPFSILTPDTETNSESSFESNNTRKDLIEEIKLTKLNLTVTSPSDGNLQFLKSVTIFIEAEDLEETKIAWKEDISEPVGNYLELEVSNEDLKEYIKKASYKLKVNTITRSTLKEDHDIEINTTFFVDAKILGI